MGQEVGEAAAAAGGKGSLTPDCQLVEGIPQSPSAPACIPSLSPHASVNTQRKAREVELRNRTVFLQVQQQPRPTLGRARSTHTISCIYFRDLAAAVGEALTKVIYSYCKFPREDFNLISFFFFLKE